jgi:hypothetical protein
MNQLQPAQARHPTTAELIDAIKRDHPTARILTKVEAITFWPEAREHLWTVLRFPEVVFYEAVVPGEKFVCHRSRYGLAPDAFLRF